MTSFAKNVALHRVKASETEAFQPNPYDAWTLDPKASLHPDEIRIDVDSICLDSTSSRQLWEKVEGNEIDFVKEIRRITDERGKMHNPDTNSGGVLLGRISEIGFERAGEILPRTAIVTLVSNTLVPLWIEKVTGFNRKSHQVHVVGSAILPRFARYARVPDYMPLAVALSVFDVCGVVPQVERLSRPGSTVVVLGAAGRAGLLATYAASRAVGKKGLVIAVVLNDSEQNSFQDPPENVRFLIRDARNAAHLEEGICEITSEKYGDVVIDCTNVTGVEIGAAASCKNGGVVYFFNMATRFQAAALGAELVNRDIQYVIGYGLLPEAEKKAIELIHSEKGLRDKFI